MMDSHDGSLQSEVLAPRRRWLTLASLWLAVGSMGVATVAAIALSARHVHVDVSVQAPVSAPVAMVAPEPMVAVAAPEPARAPEPAVVDDAVRFVVAVGDASYLVVDTDSDEDDRPPVAERIAHGAPTLIATDDMFPEAAIATVATADVPAAQRAWLERRVLVDNACEARVTRFALVSLFTGDLDYMGVDPTDGDVAAKVFGAGNVVLAAELDGCGAGFARAADAPLALPAIPVDDNALERTAKRRLLGSELARAAQTSYTAELERTGDWSKEADVTARVFRHPRTGEVFVSARAQAWFDCGGLDANLWGLYRVDDAGGLAQIRVTDLGEVNQLDTPIDIDGDGTFEWTAATMLSGPALVDDDGTVLRRVEIPFYGCPC